MCFILFYLFTFSFNFTNKYTIYFTYISSLNFWDTNIFFIVIFFSLFIYFFSRFFLIFFSVVFFKLSSFIYVVSFKYLIVNLIVGTVVIHPLGFYLCTVIFLVKLYYERRFLLVYSLSCTRGTLIYIFSVTLFLGSIWATQSASWGYFWVNDLVEWSLLFFIVYTLINLHVIKFSLRVINFFYVPILLISILAFLRFGFFSTRHNFITMEVTFYFIFLSYWSFIYFLNKNYSVKVTSTNYLVTLFILFLVIEGAPLLYIIKYTYLTLFVLFFIQRVSVYMKFYYFHSFFFNTLFVWLIFFNFFYLNYALAFDDNFTYLTFFDNYILGSLSYLSKFLTVQTLEIVSFNISNYINYTLIFLSKFKMIIVLNNSYLIYLIIFFFFLLNWLNLDFYIKKKHLFKQRGFSKIYIISKVNAIYNYIYSTKRFRIDFVYIRLFKKIFRRRFIKAKTRFFKPKYWIMFLPNFILTQKSKNARMGAGVGKFVRLASIINPGKSIIKTWYYDHYYLRCIINYLKYKIPNNFLLKNCYK